MVISKRLAATPDSHSGKTMGRKVEHGLLPLINIAVDIPDGEISEGITEHFSEATCVSENQKYGALHGKESFREAIANSYQHQHNVTLDKEDEVCILYSTKNGLVALPICVVNPGENVLLPDPGYTNYLAGVMLADANPVLLNLDPPDYLPNWDNVDKRILDNTMLAYLTYPNNPIGSTATKEVFDEAIERLKGTKTKIVHDSAYSAFGFDAKDPSILAPEHGEDVATEILSSPEGCNMSGFRVGFAVGDRGTTQALKEYQIHTSAGMLGALQGAVTYALNHYDEFLEEQNETFKRRRDKSEAKSSEAHLSFVYSKDGICSWLRMPPDYDSETFEQYLLKEKSVLAVPGIPFGENGKHYVRISFALDDKWLEETASKLTGLASMYKAKRS